ncbi:MAG: glycosyltransferase family 1 protein [Boseongicola sp.]|nr:glycosyltransferase family 1 protein [Boseongicola sp.]
MRILFTSTQGEGHIRPLLPYAKALAARGHDVLVAAPEVCAPIVAKAGLNFAPFDKMTPEQFHEIWAPHQGVRGDDMLAIGIPQMFAGMTVRMTMPKLRETVLSFRPDLIVRESVEYAGLVLAREFGIPHARVNVHNCGMEETINGFSGAPLDNFFAAFDHDARGEDVVWNEPTFTVFPTSFDGDAREGEGNPPVRVRTDLAGDIPETDWRPKGDRPLVYVTFGTVAAGLAGKGAIFPIALEAVAGVDAEVLMTVGPDFDISDLAAIPDNTVVRNFVPQAAVFPHASLMMCHGGSGSLMGGLAAGLPLVVAPLFADQFDNAARVEAAGLGLAASEPQSAEEMSTLMRRVLGSDEIAEASRKIAVEIASQVAIEDAATRLERLA